MARGARSVASLAAKADSAGCGESGGAEVFEEFDLSGQAAGQNLAGDGEQLGDPWAGHRVVHG
jgi:hypothetical protein